MLCNETARECYLQGGYLRAESGPGPVVAAFGAVWRVLRWLEMGRIILVYGDIRVGASGPPGEGVYFSYIKKGLLNLDGGVFQLHLASLKRGVLAGAAGGLMVEPSSFAVFLIDTGPGGVFRLHKKGVFQAGRGGISVTFWSTALAVLLRLGIWGSPAGFLRRRALRNQLTAVTKRRVFPTNIAGVANTGGKLFTGGGAVVAERADICK